MFHDPNFCSFLRFSFSWKTGGFLSFPSGSYGAVYSCYVPGTEGSIPLLHSVSRGIKIFGIRCSVSGPQKTLQPVCSGSSAVQSFRALYPLQILLLKLQKLFGNVQRLVPLLHRLWFPLMHFFLCGHPLHSRQIYTVVSRS